MYRENCLDLSGTQYIREMFRNTRVDGALTIEDEGENGTTWFLDWKEADMEEVIARFETLRTALAQLGREHDYWKNFEEAMPADLQEVWSTYIAPYPDHGMDHDVLFDISMKAEFDEPLTDEEKKLLNKEQEWLEDNALTRLPYNRTHPVALIQRARRYEKLIQLHAPKIVLENEERCLAEEMVLYYCLAE